MNKKLPYDLGRKRLYNQNFKNYSEDVILWEVLKIKTIQKLRFKFISTNSIHRQGVRIAIDAGDGEITINGTCSKAFDLWEDTCPNEVVITCNSSEGFLSVYNIFEKFEGWGKGRRYSQMAYSGMLLKHHKNTSMYSCNDTGFETQFDKLVFEIELLN